MPGEAGTMDENLSLSTEFLSPVLWNPGPFKGPNYKHHLSHTDSVRLRLLLIIGFGQFGERCGTAFLSGCACTLPFTAISTTMEETGVVDV